MQVQAAIGAKNAVAFDLTAACSGFVLGLVTAAQYVRTGMARHVLVIGADAMSRVVDWRDRGTCILFGDGCGAVVVSASPDGAPCSLLGVDMHSDGSGQKSLHAMYSGSGGKPFQVRVAALTAAAAAAAPMGAATRTDASVRAAFFSCLGR